MADGCECGNEPWGFREMRGNFLTSCKPFRFSRRTLHRGVSKFRTYFAAISIFMSRLLSRTTKIILYKTQIWQVVSYGPEAWTLTEKEQGEIIVKWIKGQRISSLGHLDRMEEDRLPKKIFTEEVEGTRRKGRPRKRRKDEVERDLQVLWVRKWRELVAERKKWKDIVRQAKAHSGLWCQSTKKKNCEPVYHSLIKNRPRARSFGFQIRTEAVDFPSSKFSSPSAVSRLPHILWVTSCG